MHDNIARSASASVEGEGECPGSCAPGAEQAKSEYSVWRCAGFSHPVEKTGCMWYIVTVVDK